MWLAEFLFGLFLAYYCMSPRLRGFVNKTPITIYRHTSHAKAKRIIEAEPIISERLQQVIKTPIVSYEGKHYFNITDEELQKWLDRNPDLKEVDKK